MNRALTLGVLLLSSTVFVCAQIVITEVMYDPQGATAGREWIEVQNVSSDSIYFVTWKFFEQGVNHGIASTTVDELSIGPGSFAIITTDRTKFLLDFPNVAVPIFKSSFSLSNSGEALGFKTESSGSLIEPLYTYDVTLGGAGNGNSLQKTSTGWIAALPTPGSVTTGVGLENNTGQTGGGTSTTTATTTPIDNGNTNIQPPVTTPIVSGSGSKFMIPQVFGTVSAPTVFFAGVDGDFLAKAFTGDGKEVANTQFTWNFGDGATASGPKATHRYKYPGTYSVVLESAIALGVSNSIATEYGVVTVAAPSFSIAELKDENGEAYILIENKTEYKVDISSWIIRRNENGGEHYVLPKNTFIMPYTSIRIPREVTQFNTAVESFIQLLFPNTSVAAEYDPKQNTTLVETNSTPPTIIRELSSEQENVVRVPKPLVKQDSLSTTPVQEQKEVIIEKSSLEEASTTQSLATETPLTASVIHSEQKIASLLWYAVPVLVLAIGAATFLGGRKEDDPLSEYIIIDDGK